jgi:hypothetical protein
VLVVKDSMVRFTLKFRRIVGYSELNPVYNPQKFQPPRDSYGK